MRAVPISRMAPLPSASSTTRMPVLPSSRRCGPRCAHPIEATGRELRKLMAWVDTSRDADYVGAPPPADAFRRPPVGTGESPVWVVAGEGGVGRPRTPSPSLLSSRQTISGAPPTLTGSNRAPTRTHPVGAHPTLLAPWLGLPPDHPVGAPPHPHRLPGSGSRQTPRSTRFISPLNPAAVLRVPHDLHAPSYAARYCRRSGPAQPQRAGEQAGARGLGGMS